MKSSANLMCVWFISILGHKVLEFGFVCVFCFVGVFLFCLFVCGFGIGWFGDFFLFLCFRGGSLGFFVGLFVGLVSLGFFPCLCSPASFFIAAGGAQRGS